jgi:hypothetical protein
VPQQLIQTAVELERHEGTVVADRVGETPCIFLGWSDGSSSAKACEPPRV